MTVPAYTAEAIRAAERPLLDAGRGERLMRTAAAGLAAVCRRVLVHGRAEVGGSHPVRRHVAPEGGTGCETAAEAAGGAVAGASRGAVAEAPRGAVAGTARGAVTGARVAVLAGPGNNGGDALYAAANLASRGAHVTILAPLGRLHPEAVRAARSAGAVFAEAGADPVGDPAASMGPDHHGPSRILAEADLVIDGLFGTGARLPLREPLSELIRDWQTQRRARESAWVRSQTVVAVDMPTGVDATTGAHGEVHVRADVTVTFGGCKAGQFLPGGAEACGAVILVDIGLDLEASEPLLWAYSNADLAGADVGCTGLGGTGSGDADGCTGLGGWPLPGRRDHKYTRGVLGVIAGSARYPGAGVLTATAAVAAGVGMLRVQGAKAVQEAVVAAAPEAVTAPGRVQAWVMGPGAPEPQDMMEFLMEAVGAGTPLVLDAGALAVVPALVRAAHGASPLPGGSVLTPHAGELAELLRALPEGDLGARGDAGSEQAEQVAAPSRADIESDPARWVREAARRTGAVVLLKGPRTLIATPDGALRAPAPGPALLATAGSGDVLAGLIGAALTAGRPAEAADPHARAAHLAALAVLLHNRAGRAATHASGQVRAVEDEVVRLAHGTAAR
ncbi:bifunctional ADP-dependent NAD(P)H-hydrate dehydratase/NAD(P)H-hydrate epimerase [Brevibacterium album]|uniref:bifunctional ADP-dependent NAD(P)H-hydrate dehydratase/NAD(P)H-hydrate epimerase n=1 Tax=Brevibacterium album TaxID=417948 RepID=UPI00040D110C|nr:bifunctional ADP-dependent NAD(P)H-hydrate dehydratase/NAD(P)H-hydrate epimerase [Brevibacterium album]